MIYINNVENNITNIKNLMGTKNELVIRNFIIGKDDFLEAAILYMNGLANKDMIDRDILNPLMLHTSDENFGKVNNLENYIYKKYITVSNTDIEPDIVKACDSIKKGKTVLIIQNCSNFIVIDTTGGVHRNISEPVNETSLKGPREGFVENLETNLSILRRRIKDKNLVTEKFIIGKRSQTDLVLIYIDDIVNKDFLQKIKDKINTIDIDEALGNSIIEQCIEQHPYSIFPQIHGSERPDIIQAALMEGRVAFLLNGTPYVATYPSVFIEFFQTMEDYYGRTLVSSITRIIRIIATIIVLFLPAIYITFIKYNQELIPAEFVKSLMQSRKGIALTPFMSLFLIKIIIDLLREGGLRLPSKIGQTLSVVGGIIIGDTAVKSKGISSTTMLVAGIATVASFAISNYEMSSAIRIMGYPMLLLSNWLGMLGIVIGGFFILAYLCSTENFGVPYFSLSKSDMKDTFYRAPIWKMNKRPDAIPHNDPVRQNDFRGDKNE